MTEFAGEQTTEGGGQTADAELLRRYLAERDEGVFAELVRRHVNLVYRAALRQLGGDAHRAQDATQLVFTLLARKATALARHPSLTGWLYTTTHFIVRDLLRAERRRRQRETEARLMHELTREPSPDWDRLRPVLDDAMQALNERDRDALLARFFEGRPFAELGARLALSEDAARMRVDRALEKLRALLARRGVTSTTAALGALMTHEAAASVPAGLAASVTGAALAAPAAAGLTTALAFMSTVKFTLTATVAALLAVGAAVHQTSAARVTRTALVAEQQGRDALAARVREAGRQATAAQGALAAARDQLAAVPLTPAAAPATQPPDPSALGEAIMQAHPELRAAFIANQKAGVSGQYYPLYVRLGLSEAQIDEFEEIMSGGAPQSVSNYPGVGTVRFDARPRLPVEERTRRLQALLGEAGIQAMREHELRMLSSHVNQVASTLYFTDTPLTAAQAERLGDVLREQQSRRGREPPTPTVFWAGVLDRAREFLSAPQVQALDGLRARDEFAWARQQVRSAEKKP